MKTSTALVKLITAVTLLSAVLTHEASLATREVEFRHPVPLKGVSRVDLDLRIWPDPLDGGQLYKSAMKEFIMQKLFGAGLNQEGIYEEFTPRLRVAVVMLRNQPQYIYRISVEVHESCYSTRRPDWWLPSCITWSTEPSVQFLGSSNRSEIKQHTLAAVDEFIQAHGRDNR